MDAIDRTTIAEQLYGAGGTPGCNIVPNPSAVRSPNNDDCIVQDIDAANALLDENGYLDTDGDGVPDTAPVAGVPLTISQDGTSIGELTVDEASILKYMGDQDWLAFGAALLYSGDWQGAVPPLRQALEAAPEAPPAPPRNRWRIAPPQRRA